MENKINKKDNKNIKKDAVVNNNTLQKKKLQTNIRPQSSKINSNNKLNINNSKKTNIQKQANIHDLNEVFKVEPKNQIQNKISTKKEINKNIINKNNINKSKESQSKTPKNLSTIDEMENLTSLHNALLFLSLKLDSTFLSQKNEVEQELYNKYNEAINLKEKNFKLYQQINSMTNIIGIDNYFINNYNKIMEVFPKISNVVENMNDIVSNINYGLDRIYLIDDLLCDENLLQKNIIQIQKDFAQLNNNLEKKIDEINANKLKYEEIISKINSNDEKLKKIENKLGDYKHNVLTNNIDVIYQKLSEKNKKLLDNILNDD